VKENISHKIKLNVKLQTSEEEGVTVC